MQQTNFNFELVIGEDCSDDNTRSICIKYQQEHPEIIKLLMPEKNLGANENFLQTFSYCNGKYIAICEGDDYWTDPNKLQKQVDFLESHPDYGMVHCNCDYFFQHKNTFEKNVLDKYDIDYLQGNIYNAQLESNKIMTLTVMIRKKIMQTNLQEIRSFNQKWLMGDKPLWLLTAHKYKIGYIPKSMGVYRVHYSSTVNTLSQKKLFNFLKSSFEVNYFFIQKFGCSESTYKIVERNYNEFLLKSGYSLIDKSLAIPAFQYFKSLSQINMEILMMYGGSFNQFFHFMARVFLKFLKITNKRKLSGL